MEMSFFSTSIFFAIVIPTLIALKHLIAVSSRWPRGSLVAQKLLLCGKIKKVLSHANVCSLEQRARNVHDQNEQTFHHFVIFSQATGQTWYHTNGYQLYLPLSRSSYSFSASLKYGEFKSGGRIKI